MTKDDFQASAGITAKNASDEGKSTTAQVVSFSPPQPQLQGPRPPAPRGAPRGVPQGMYVMPVATAIKILPAPLQVVKSASVFIDESGRDEK